MSRKKVNGRKQLWWVRQLLTNNNKNKNREKRKKKKNGSTNSTQTLSIHV